MVWVRLEDTFPEHPKVDKAGGDAAWLHVCGIAYCNRNETDGFIATDRVSRLSDRKRPLNLAARLVEVGLWEIDPRGGWLIHDYLHYQPSKASRDEERDKARERMRKARSGNVRPNNQRSSPNPDPTRPDPLVKEGETSTSQTAGRLDDIALHYGIKALQAAKGRGEQIGNDARYSGAAAERIASEPDLARLAGMFPTAPPDAVASWLMGDKHSQRYYPRADEIDAPSENAENFLAPVMALGGRRKGAAS